MAVLFHVISLVYLIFTVLYNLSVLLYSLFLLHVDDEPADLESKIHLTSEEEITCMKYGAPELIRITIAQLMEKGCVTVKEIIEHHEREYSRGCNDDSCFPHDRSYTTYSYRYCALPGIEPSGLSPLQQQVFSDLDRFKTAGQVAYDLKEMPLFRACRDKMRELQLVRDKNNLEGGIELFYNISYGALAVMILLHLAMFRIPLVEQLLVITFLNSTMGIITRLIWYRGRMNYDQIYPGGLPTPALQRFIRAYERDIAPVMGSFYMRDILEGRRLQSRFR